SLLVGRTQQGLATMGKLYLALRDKRMKGKIFARENLAIINTDADTPVTQAIGQIKAIAKWRGKIDTMFILCHGWESQDLAHAMFKDEGGWGLEIGKEGIDVNSVSLWKGVSGVISNIVVYGCGAAHTTRKKEGKDGDGRFLMKQLASFTKATVFASPA